MSKKEQKQKAQDLIMSHISSIGYGTPYEDFVKEIGSTEEAERILMEQMNRIAKIFGYKKAWFS